MTIFLIPGYGIPKNGIVGNRNYRTYLDIVFNTIYKRSRGEYAILMPCGGATACHAPGEGYDGTEAEMMGSELAVMCQREETKEDCKEWRIILQDRSLSSLENLHHAKEKLAEQEIPIQPIIIFCEETRRQSTMLLGLRILQPSVPEIIPVDFDTSQNRYAPKAIIAAREEAAVASCLWTLKNPERQAAHRALCEEKLAFLRNRQKEGASHELAVSEWQRLAPAKLAKHMPDHPSLTPQ